MPWCCLVESSTGAGVEGNLARIIHLRGKADTVIVLSKSAILADAAATAIGKLITQPSDIPSGIEFAKGIEGLRGVIIIEGDNMGLRGEVKICQTFA